MEIVLEFALQDVFENILQIHLLDPLRLSNTFIDKSRYNEIVKAYNRNLMEVKPWEFRSFAGSEGINSTVGDLINFISAQMDNTSRFSKIFQDNHIIEVPTGYNNNLFVGKAWHIVKNRGHFNIINHTGKTSGHQSFVAFIKETGTAVIILCNSAHGVDDLGFLILRMINYNWRRKN